MLVDVADCADAARQAVEMAREILKTHSAVLHQLVAMQPAVVIAHAAAQRPAFAYGSRGSGIDAEVEQAIVGNEVLLAFVARFLIHAADAR